MIADALLAFALHVTADPAPVPSPSRSTAAARPNRGLPRSPEFTAAHSRLAHDLRGAMTSLYRGRYFHASQEALRRCIGQREGMFQYDVRGGGGGNYFGTYQFSRAFQNGIPYMMATESRATHDGLTVEALSLRGKAINAWSRYWQDRAWYTVMNYNGIGSGRHHWAGGRWACS